MSSSPARNGPLRRLQRAMCITVGLVIRVLFGLRAWNVPTLTGPFILAPNHTSFLDPLLLQLSLPRHITFLMDGPIFEHKACNWFYRFWGAIPIPAARRAAAGAMKLALKAAASGAVVAIFPEGQISKDGHLGSGRAGVAMLMQKSSVPVIPVAIFGARQVLPRWANFPRAGRLLVVFGEPITAVANDEIDKKDAAEKLKDDVMTAIAALQERYRSYL